MGAGRLLLLAQVLLFAALLCHAGPASSAAGAEEASADDPSFNLPSGYNKRVRPTAVNEPGHPDRHRDATKVKVNLDVRHLYEIAANTGTATMEVRLELEWIDSRLQNIVPLDMDLPVDPQKVWVPAATISNQIEPPTVVAKLMQINRDGRVKYIRRMKVTCSQSFDGLLDYPFDHHRVQVDLESYGYSAEQVALYPWNGNRTEMTVGRPLRKSLNGITSGVWDIWSYDLSYNEAPSLNFPAPQKDMYLHGNLWISRKELMPFVEIVIPLLITVALSMSALIYRMQALDIRTNLVVCGLFSTLVYLYVVKADLPPISALTWTHYYMMLCLLYVLICIAEITICHYLDPTGEAGEIQVQQQADKILGNEDGAKTPRLRSRASSRLNQYNSGLDYGHGSPTMRSPRDSRRASRRDGADQPLLGVETNMDFLNMGMQETPVPTDQDIIHAFKEIDADNNGFLTQSEIKAAFMTKLDIKISDDEISEMITKAKEHVKPKESRVIDLQVVGADGAAPGGGATRPDALNLKEFAWAARNLRNFRQLQFEATPRLLGMTESNVPSLDKWCGRIVPSSFAVIVLIMLCVEIPNMLWRGPPGRYSVV